jgi:hypothetical protein
MRRLINYVFFNIIRIIKLERVRLARHTVFMGEMRNVYKVFFIIA